MAGSWAHQSDLRRRLSVFPEFRIAELPDSIVSASGVVSYLLSSFGPSEKACTQSVQPPTRVMNVTSRTCVPKTLAHMCVSQRSGYHNQPQRIARGTYWLTSSLTACFAYSCFVSGDAGDAVDAGNSVHRDSRECLR